MKKIICVLLVICFMLTGFGCGKKSENTAPQESSGEVQSGEAQQSEETEYTSDVGAMGMISANYAEAKAKMGGSAVNAFYNDGVCYRFTSDGPGYGFENTENFVPEGGSEIYAGDEGFKEPQDTARCVKIVCTVEDIIKISGESYSIAAIEQYVNVEFGDVQKDGDIYRYTGENDNFSVTVECTQEGVAFRDDAVVIRIK